MYLAVSCYSMAQMLEYIYIAITYFDRNSNPVQLNPITGKLRNYLGSHILLSDFQTCCKMLLVKKIMKKTSFTLP